MENLVFDEKLLIQEANFSFKGIDYVLRTGSAGAVAAYNNMRGNKTTYVNGEVSTVKDGGELKPYLVQLCSFTVSDNKPVPLSVIKEWPEPMVDKLFDTAKRLSDIDQPATVAFIDEKIAVLQEMRTLLLTKETELKNG